VTRLMRADWHLHTTFSRECGEPGATPGNIVNTAHDIGLEAIGFTDHIHFPHQIERIDELRAVLPAPPDGLRVYVACEADMLSPTTVAISAETAAGLDYVIVSASHLYEDNLELPADLDPPRMASFILELTNGAIASGLADIVAHPFGVPGCPFPWAEVVAAADPGALRETAREAARRGVAMELNPRYVRQAPEQAGWLFRLFLESGCRLALVSDAHHPDLIGCRGPRFAPEAEVRALGVTEECLWDIRHRLGGGRNALT
jgi:histidinol phosphatase-like PHP family hydrolase